MPTQFFKLHASRAKSIDHLLTLILEINSMKMLIQSLSEDNDDIEMVEEEQGTFFEESEVSHHDYNQPSSSDDDKPVVNQNRRDTSTHNKGRRGAFISI